jgi:RNA polymerase sigma factor (sigma-70 family)
VFALIDDERAVLDALQQYLARQGVSASCFHAAKERYWSAGHLNHRPWRCRYGSRRHQERRVRFHREAFDEARLLASIRDSTERAGQSESTAAEVDELQARFDSLSARRREVMEMAITGLSSKEIGRKLNISPKTVENHRSWVMERIGARNLADLIRKAMKLQA